MILFLVPLSKSYPSGLYRSDLKTPLIVFSTVNELINDDGLAVNNIARILGYYEINDGGAADYIIKYVDPGNSSLEEYHITLSNGLKAFLLEPQTINYKMFGAKGDSINNDAVQISKAHRYANARNIPIVNHKGEFWLKENEKIIIQTDVDWGNTVFHIDEKYNSLTDFRFEVTSKENPKNIVLSAEEKKKLLLDLNSDKMVIPTLKPYKNHLIIITDSNDRIGFRAGASYKGQSWAREDFFYVEESGKVIGDITWSFKNYTKLTAYPVDKNYLHLQGGIFYLSGENPSSRRGYYKNGIQVRRSRTTISNQWIGLEPGKEDTTTTSPRNGFYSFSNVYDVRLENVRLTPYLYTRESGNNVHSGTYGISMGRVLKSHFKNVTAEGSQNHWGVFGTNLNKDLKIENCLLNRVDIHFHCWNLSILDSHIGERGITATGGGSLIINNSSCAGTSFINFRSDYGSRWDGDITITNSLFKVSRNLPNISILNFSPHNFDYKYPIRFGRNIRIENFKVDFSGVEQKEATCWVMRVPQFSVMEHGERLYFPNFIKFKNIEVIDRKKGIRLLSVPDQGGYQVDKYGGYKNNILQTNVILNFNNIQLEDLSKEINQYHFTMQSPEKALYNNSLYPSILFSNCSNIAIQNDGYIANIFFEKCSITNITGNKDKPLKGRFVFSNCEFNPAIRNEIEIAYSLSSTCGIFFSNCIVNPPVYFGEERIDLFDKIGFIQLNKNVDFNHSNTSLNKNIIEFYKDEIDPQFLLKLRGYPQTNVEFSQE
ncbi:hypothetical protein [Proteiniphilum acetatigenes]|uniref:hypothetical protein n=1 Tax=Proteiniphilum acetatigenes TaxID=294710 RepID=UPI0012F87D63|nr:hypothetical protein [Proteiniphilum acetatigenes]